MPTPKQSTTVLPGVIYLLLVVFGGLIVGSTFMHRAGLVAGAFKDGFDEGLSQPLPPGYTGRVSPPPTEYHGPGALTVLGTIAVIIVAWLVLGVIASRLYRWGVPWKAQSAIGLQVALWPLYLVGLVLAWTFIAVRWAATVPISRRARYDRLLERIEQMEADQ